MAYKQFYDIPDMLNFYIASYYGKVEKSPGIRRDPIAHAKFIEHTNYDYQSALKLRSKHFNYEENKDKFTDKMELLTGYRSKLEEVHDRKRRRLKLFEDSKIKIPD
jgi:hypothetical protein